MFKSVNYILNILTAKFFLKKIRFSLNVKSVLTEKNDCANIPILNPCESENRNFQATDSHNVFCLSSYLSRAIK